MTIRVDDPIKSSDGSYITFRVFTMVKFGFFSIKQTSKRKEKKTDRIRNVLC